MGLSKTSPKARFVATESERVALEKLTNAEWYYAAVQAALATYVRNITLDTSELKAGAKFYVIRGAREFAEILLTMADRPKPEVSTTRATLNHNQ